MSHMRAEWEEVMGLEVFELSKHFYSQCRAESIALTLCNSPMEDTGDFGIACNLSLPLVPQTSILMESLGGRLRLFGVDRALIQ